MRSPLLALAALTMLPTAVLAAPSAMGLWQTPVDHAQIEVAPCGAALCGKIASSDQITADPGVKDSRNKNAALRDRTLKGLTIVTGFTGGPTEWKGGKVYDPKTGNTYSGSIKLLAADSLKLTGCIVAPLCQSQTWKRAR